MIIQSLLDTDFYKLTMMQAVLHQFPGAMVEYRFRCRNDGMDIAQFVDEIWENIHALCKLRLTKDELDYLSSIRFFKSDFIEFLRIFSLSADFIEINVENGFELSIKGPWLHTILFEVPVLAIISEVYTSNTHPGLDFSEGEKRLTDKINYLKQHIGTPDFKFSDFGTRRRFSHAWQEHVLINLARELPEHYSGTSNVYFAMKHDWTPIGTMAHEYLQACQSLGPRLIYSQKFAFEKWAQEYRGELGIALSDVFGMDAFFRDFDLYFCKLFDGARQDSGDPIEWTDKMLAHYKAHRIDARTKTLVYSDSLSIPKAVEIYKRYHKQTSTVFGIGTNLTNDLGPTPLNNVIKMVYCNGQPVAKVSDSPGKSMCSDDSYIRYLKKVFQIEDDGYTHHR